MLSVFLWVRSFPVCRALFLLTDCGLGGMIAQGSSSRHKMTGILAKGR